MRPDPRRNFAATSAGVLAIAEFVAIEIVAPIERVNVLRLALLLAGIVCLVAGSWPSRRVRFALLLVAAPAILIVGIAALWTVGILIVPVALVACYGLVLEYAREGRE